MLRIARLIQVAVVGRDHAALGAVDEDRHAAGPRFDLVAERADQVGAENADAVAEHLRMDRVIHQRGDGFALRAHRLDDTHPAIVQIGRVIVVRDFSLGLARGNLERSRLKLVDGGVHGLGGLGADEVHVLEIAGVPAQAIGKGVTIRSAVGVRRGDEDVVGRNAAHLCPDAIPKHGGKAKQVESHHRDRHVPFAKDERPSRQLPTFLLGRPRLTHAA